MTAVPAKHSIALCKQCSEGSQLKSSRVHSINVGDLVEWSVVSKMQGQTHNCTMIISQVLGGNKSMYSTSMEKKLHLYPINLNYAHPSKKSVNYL